MNVFINDISTELANGATLADVLDVKEVKPQGVATAVNGNVIPASKRNETILSDGDKIIIIKAFYGG